MKAFLSHSSKDKEFIREIADQLGRLHSIFDERCFETGKEFQDSILEYLEATSVFVFFATKSSLESFWVQFELESAFYNKISGKLDKALVYIIDDEVNHSDIPAWLQKALIKKVQSPAVIVREIKDHLNKIEQSYQRQYFFGRSNDREKFEELLFPIDGTKQPKVFMIKGLPGVGRRTFLKKSVNQLFGLNRIIEISMEEGDTINDLSAKLADIIEPYSCQDELKNIIKDILLLNSDQVLERILKQLQNIILAGELPVFVNNGGLVNDNGYLKDFVNQVISGIHIQQDIYLGIISSRKISQDNEHIIPNLYLNSLEHKPTSQLLTKLNEDKETGLSTKEILELATYVHGYPPLAFFAISQAQIYGKDIIMSDKVSLSTFSRKKFVAYLEDKKLDEDLITFISILAVFSPLPLNVLAAINNDSNKTHALIYKLMDNSLINVNSYGYYKISDPIKIAVNILYKLPEKNILRKISTALLQYVNDSDGEKKLDLSRVLSRIGNWVEDKDAIEKGITLKSDFIKMLEQAYHQREFKKAIEYGLQAIQESPDNEKARSFLVRSMIQLEKWSQAIEQIDAMDGVFELRNVYFLEGFLERKRGRIKEAIYAFTEAEKNGRSGSDIARELAHCYLLQEDLIPAERYINKALKTQADDSHIVDLATKISIKKKDEELSQKRLASLKTLDESEYYYLRESTFHYTFSRFTESKQSAEKAIEFGGKRFFSGYVQYIKSLIKNKDFLDAEKALNILDSQFKDNKNDLRLTLRCSFFMEKGEFKKAYETTKRMINKKSGQYQTIRKKCLGNLAKNMSISYAERKKYGIELMEFSSLYEIDELEAIEL